MTSKGKFQGQLCFPYHMMALKDRAKERVNRHMRMELCMKHFCKLGSILAVNPFSSVGISSFVLNGSVPSNSKTLIARETQGRSRIQFANTPLHRDKRIGLFLAHM